MSTAHASLTTSTVLVGVPGCAFVQDLPPDAVQTPGTLLWLGTLWPRTLGRCLLFAGILVSWPCQCQMSATAYVYIYMYK